MRISVDTQNIVMTSNEKLNIIRHTETLFSRVRDLVHSVKITLSDANGPKGGVDKECTVIVNGKTPAAVIIKDRQITQSMAVFRALQRANFSFLRKVKRQKTVRRDKMTIVDEEAI